MGKITEVFYKEIDPEICNVKDASKYNYLANLLKYHKIFQDEYEKYELNQINLRNNIIGDAIRNNEISNNLKMHSTILGISALKNKAVLITEIQN